MSVCIAVGGKHFGHAQICFLDGDLEFLLSCKQLPFLLLFHSISVSKERENAESFNLKHWNHFWSHQHQWEDDPLLEEKS